MTTYNRRGLILTIILLSILFLLVTAPAVTKADGNLAPNPSFESDPYTDYTTHGNGKFSHASANHTGSHSVKIVRGSGDLSDNFGHWMTKIKKIEIPNGTDKLTLQVWLKGSDLISEEVQIGFTYWDGNQDYITAKFKHVTPGGSWSKYTLSSSNVPSNDTVLLSIVGG